MILCSTHENVFEYISTSKYKTDDTTDEAKILKDKIKLLINDGGVQYINDCFNERLKIYN